MDPVVVDVVVVVAAAVVVVVVVLVLNDPRCPEQRSSTCRGSGW